MATSPATRPEQTVFRAVLAAMVLGGLLFGCAPAPASPRVEVARVRPAAGPPTAVTAAVDFPRHSEVVLAAKRAVAYYQPSYNVAASPRNGWSWATYSDGLQQLYRLTGDHAYVTDLGQWATEHHWSASTVGRNPDSVKAGQTYFDIAPIITTASLAPMDTQMSADLAGLPDSQYSWIDALFMGMPNWPRWAARTGNPAYLDKMDALFRATRDNGITSQSTCNGKTPGLYDITEHLWYRDCRFIGARDATGHKIFWARGNAWVLAGMAEVLQALPVGDARAGVYRDLLRTMAERLRGLQDADGFWRSSLLSPDLYPQAETSSTALITYALGYGVRAGLLDRATYVPVIAQAWHGLMRQALQPSGFLSGCQPVGYQPAASFSGNRPTAPATTSSPGSLHSDSPPYCVGAFLLATSEVGRLSGAVSAGRPINATAQQVGNEARRAVDGDVTTRWSAKGFPQSLTVDLGPGIQASNAAVTPYLDRAYRYRVAASSDGVHWTDVVDRTSNTSPGALVDDFQGGPIALRYARLTVTGVYGAATTWVSVDEFSVHDRFLPRVNLSYHRPTSATSYDGSSPGNATDNATNTSWRSAYQPSATAPQELTVDLQSLATVDSVRIDAPVGHGARDATVEISADATTWTIAARLPLRDTAEPQLVLFPVAKARWVRLSTASAYGTSGVGISEFATYQP